MSEPYRSLHAYVGEGGEWRLGTGVPDGRDCCQHARNGEADSQKGGEGEREGEGEGMIKIEFHLFSTTLYSTYVELSCPRVYAVATG